MSRHQLVVFDWDGTLCDSTDTIVKAIQVAAEVQRLPVLEGSLCREIIGLALEPALKTLYPELDQSQLTQLCGSYRESYRDLTAQGVNLYPGALEVIDVLRSRGFRLAVATSKTRMGLDSAIRMTGLDRGVFQASRCADESESKPSPLMLLQLMEQCQVEATQVVMVGDTEFDLEMARRAEVDSIGVDFGAHDRDRLLACDPLAVISHLRELSEVL